jgi:predicted  nucleic acid-binding Zn-ribbon protein|tara:strand:+ start:151 stop:666 length:516 start_codon:yes stop_codon:yes gene_type:complete
MTDQELNIGGVKVKAGGKAGKIFLYATLATSIVGGLYGGFEVYKDYQDMKAKIESYVAPDLSSMREKIAVMEEQVVSAQGYTRDIKIDLKKDIQRIELRTESTERRVKDTQHATDSTLREVEIVNRESEKDTRDRMREAEDRIEASMARLEKKLKEQLEEALTNPLNNMNK